MLWQFSWSIDFAGAQDSIDVVAARDNTPTHAQFVRWHLWKLTASLIDSLGISECPRVKPAIRKEHHRWLEAAFELACGRPADTTKQAGNTIEYHVTKWQLKLRDIGRDASGRRAVERQLRMAATLQLASDSAPDEIETLQIRSVATDTLDYAVFSQLSDPTDEFLRPAIEVSRSRQWLEPLAIAAVVGSVTILFFSVR